VGMWEKNQRREEDQVSQKTIIHDGFCQQTDNHSNAINRVNNTLDILFTKPANATLKTQERKERKGQQANQASSIRAFLSPPLGWRSSAPAKASSSSGTSLLRLRPFIFLVCSWLRSCLPVWMRPILSPMMSVSMFFFVRACEVVS
jgi:hypothetical protein